MPTHGSWALSREFPAGTVLFEEGDPGSRMYVIRSGKVRIYRKIGESEIVLAFLGSGDFFGEMAILEHLPRSAHAQVTEPSELIELDEGTFELMVQRNSEIGLRIMRKLAARVRDLDHRLEDLLLDSALGRAVEVLRWLSEQGVAEGDRIRLPDSVGHVDIAAQAGIPHEQAKAVIEQLERAGLLSHDANTTVVASPTTLDRFGAYLALKQQYEPRAATALPPEAHHDKAEEKQRALRRLFAAVHTSPEEFEQNQAALKAQYQRFLELRTQFREAEEQESP